MPDGDEEQTRTFKIEGPAKRKFDIHTQPRSDRLPATRGRLRIDGDRVPTRLPNSNREIMFARQRNAYDCGPCLVLNTLQALRVDTGLSAVTDVRAYVNQSRITANEAARVRGAHVDDPSLSAGGRFTNGDVDGVLRAQGLDVQSWTVDSAEARANVQAYVDQLARGGQEVVVYSGNGEHYRGIYQTGGRSYMLDSLKPDVTQVGSESIQSMLTSAGNSDRRESVAVATRPVAAPAAIT